MSIAKKNTTNETKQGYLLKRGEVRKGWKVRWFVVHDQQVRYFKTQEDFTSSPDSFIDFIPLDQSVVKESNEEGKSNCFQIITKHRIYYLVAKSKQDQESWLRSLSDLTLLPSEDDLFVFADDEISKMTRETSQMEDYFRQKSGRLYF
eukprot:TRINITY_DN2778_c0_g1_i1.p1 TRINITY_DN2778_c0_g1~~TRINITY_DN2778_c0_g1_i1.p1  ORF type:complete len:148 (+),score=29.91 TRINITY_DN2778_c0_g1_i1:154-597(+)